MVPTRVLDAACSASMVGPKAPMAGEGGGESGGEQLGGGGLTVPELELLAALGRGARLGGAALRSGGLARHAVGAGDACPVGGVGAVPVGRWWWQSPRGCFVVLRQVLPLALVPEHCTAADMVEKARKRCC
jgi:hypothetical protein